MRASLRRLLFRLPLEAYLLHDDFTDTLAAGSVNGTLAVPGPGTRTVFDSAANLSLSAGKMIFAAGVGQGDPRFYLSVQSRVAGKMMLCKFNWPVAKNILCMGWGTDQTGTTTTTRGGLDIEFRPSATTERIYGGGIGGEFIQSAVAATDYIIAEILRSVGGFVFMKGGIYTMWSLVGIIDVGNTASLYPGVADNVSAINCDFLRVPVTLWLPTPLASDGMSSATLTDGLGHAETSGLGAGGSNVPWATAATWAVAGGVALNTPNLSVTEQITNPDMELDANWANSGTPTTNERSSEQAHGGTYSRKIVTDAAYEGIAQNQTWILNQWIMGSFWVYGDGTHTISLSISNGNVLEIYTANNPAAWSQIRGTSRIVNTTGGLSIRSQNAGATFYVDDVSIKALTTRELFRILTASMTADVLAQVKVGALTAWMQAGLAVRLNDPTTPTAGIVAYFDGHGNVVCCEFSGSTWTQLFTAAKAYTSGDSLQLIADGANIRLIHLTSAGVATLIGSTASATITSGGYHGLFSTDSGNQLDNLVVYPRGTGGEYSILNRWLQ